MERISYKNITIALLVVVAVLSIAHTVITKLQFRDAALRAQAASLSRVIEVASDETMKLVHNEAFLLANDLQSRLIDPRTRQLLDQQALRTVLDDLFIHGFAGAGALDLAKLRVYDSGLHLVTQSGQGAQDLPESAPGFLLKHALPRKGVDRLKALGGMWQAPSRPFYSVLLPIGGLQLSGYLEVVLDPVYNLGNVSAMTKLPIRITTLDGQQMFESPALRTMQESDLLQVEYLLHDDREQALYRITAYASTSAFQSDLQATQYGSTITVIIITLALLLLALYLLNRLLFRPVSNLIDGVQQCMDGKLETIIKEEGVKEVHLLANAFNSMAIALRRNMEELQRLSSLDGLTGIANRRIFDMQIEQEWTRALRNRLPLAVVILDIDNFKAYNDSLGHQAGDNCLREVANLLQNEMKRPGDTVARYGGEEFAIILPDTDIFGAGVVALNIRNALQNRALPHPASAVAPMVTLSIGVNVIIPKSTDTIQEFIGGADRALYMVKNSGRNNICFADKAAREPRNGNMMKSHH